MSTTNEENYTSWEELRRMIRDDQDLKKNPGYKSVLEEKIDIVEAMLDGPNDEFNQEEYLLLKADLMKDYLEFHQPVKLKKVS